MAVAAHAGHHVLSELSPTMSPSVNCPFRFETMWLTHNEFKGLVQHSWAQADFVHSSAITIFKAVAQRWNKDTFRNVFRRKRTCLARLAGIQRSLALRPTSSLVAAPLITSFFSARLFIPSVSVKENKLMSCVSSPTTSILLNGSSLDSFSPSRGIRQGHPPSLYLFILCMEYLVHLIENMIEARTWKGVEPTRNSFSMTHLLFADDILLMGSTSPATLNAAKSALQSFCQESGMRINLEKSKLHFSRNTSPTHRQQTCLTFNITETEDLGKYLEFPIGLSPRKERDFNFVVEKVRTNLAGWKASMLSMAGRVLLINTTCAATPSYFMQCSRLLQSTLSKLDRLNRDFLWGSTSTKRKIHLVSWEVATMSKASGGLGIPNMNLRNKALLGNLVSRAASSGEPWARLLRHQFTTNKPACLSSGSSNWKALRTGMDVWEMGAKWLIGNGASALFWSDR
ncbi:hypothetical protein CRG98_034859 [Punica granatum]|uniref:Reverse transcriptase domain-containing protein n=1 Tax=Punica granatum TaxID=22663 RepID=A0A2I0IM75_PUNGR|nr:hypothetical protein CRG98_034859 [Punica granatum]